MGPLCLRVPPIFLKSLLLEVGRRFPGVFLGWVIFPFYQVLVSFSFLSVLENLLDYIVLLTKLFDFQISFEFGVFWCWFEQGYVYGWEYPHGFW